MQICCISFKSCVLGSALIAFRQLYIAAIVKNYVQYVLSYCPGKSEIIYRLSFYAEDCKFSLKCLYICTDLEYHQ